MNFKGRWKQFIALREQKSFLLHICFCLCVIDCNSMPETSLLTRTLLVLDYGLPRCCFTCALYIKPYLQAIGTGSQEKSGWFGFAACGGLSMLSPRSDTIGKCGPVGVEEVYHCGCGV
uniref:Predicted gene 10283 n=1 Tax=Mus musculus TaxID=10090 RepID=Q8C3L5_MOUSE|nr:unnamed protein product [Mus musculus]